MKGAARTGMACGAVLAAVLLAVSPLALAQRQQSRPQHEERPRNAQPRGEQRSGIRQRAPRQERQFKRQGSAPQQNRELRQEYRNAPRPNRNSIPQYRGLENPSRQQAEPRFSRPAYPNVAPRGEMGARPGYTRPGYSNYPAPVYAPPGHLGAWLNEHRNVPAQEQERMLRNDPSFSRLPQSDQQRLVRQLNRVDEMPEAQRERRLARAEALERLSPQQRAQVNLSARRWATMPGDRQTVMRQAFRDLRGVPPGQRETVLNSDRYRNAFNPEERGVLSDMLRVEPYEPPR